MNVDFPVLPITIIINVIAALLLLNAYYIIYMYIYSDIFIHKQVLGAGGTTTSSIEYITYNKICESIE